MHSNLSTGFVALVGSPNSGKTTLFNWLTGSRFKTVNYPGSTVDYSVGNSQERYGAPLSVMDTPGVYSLMPKSPDERVTFSAIFEHAILGPAALVVAVIDATHLSRHLLLVEQLKTAGFRLIVAVTMVDLLKARGENLDLQKLSEKIGLPVIAVDGRLGGGVEELVQTMHAQMLKPASQVKPLVGWTENRTEDVLRTMQKTGAEVIQFDPRAKVRDAVARSRKIDRVLLHPIWGFTIFLLIMASLFTSIFWMATPAMDFVDTVFSYFGAQVEQLAPDALWTSFISSGIIASFAAVLVFVPQIFILFVGIICLEDSGYLARTATLMDRPFSWLGLNGRSFVPVLSAYACAVPAMMAARGINSKRERWITLFILPLMSCSARLPVYALLLTFIFAGQSAWKGGLFLTGLYVASLLVGAIAAMIVNRFIKIEDKSFFMLELPVYRRPDPKVVLLTAFKRTASYVTRAGPPIFVFALIIWVATTFPNYKAEPSLRIQDSYAAQVGHLIEPVFEPLGGDWRVGVGLISAFAAREVFVSSLALVFQVTDENEDTMQESLLTQMREAKMPDGSPVFTFASVMGLILFFMIALQCLSTTAVAVREFGGWRFAILQLVVFNVAAYVLAAMTVQGLRALGIA